MIILSSAVVPGGGLATALRDAKNLPLARFLRTPRPERRFAIAGPSAAGRAAASKSRSEESLAELEDYPLFLQVRSTRAGGEIGGQSDSYSLHGALLRSPAPASADQSGSFSVEGKGYGQDAVRGLSVEAGNFAISDLSSREGVSIFGAVKADNLKGRVEVNASNDGPEASVGTGAGRPDTVEFILVSVLLLFVFWMGNYVIPDLIFKDTVFKDSSKAPDTDSADPIDTSLSEEGKLTRSRGESSDRSFTRAEDGDSEQMMRKVGTGFGAGAERQSKKAKRK